MPAFACLARIAVFCLSATVASAGTAERNLETCLARTDADFDATRGAEVPVRTAAMQQAGLAESECLTFALMTCSQKGAKPGCLPAVQDFLDAALGQARAKLPFDDEVPEPMRETFAQWRDDNPPGQPPRAVPCVLVDLSGPAGCAALNTGSALIDVRVWLRVFRMFDDLQ